MFVPAFTQGLCTELDPLYLKTVANYCYVNDQNILIFLWHITIKLYCTVYEWQGTYIWHGEYMWIYKTELKVNETDWMCELGIQFYNFITTPSTIIDLFFPKQLIFTGNAALQSFQQQSCW